MKKLLFILTLFFLILNTVCAEGIKTVKQPYKITASDGFTVNAVLEYPKDKSKMEYKTVVLLHSLGYDSQWWADLPQDLLNNGYAVLTIDLRGHGTSVYNKKLTRVSWKSMTNKAFAKYPEDVEDIINLVISENKRKFFNDWAIVGVDIGAVTGIYVANELPNKPKTIVMISPITKSKGLYAPVKLAEIDNVDILSITGAKDVDGKKSEAYLKKFAQSAFVSYTSESKSAGMLMFKSDETLSNVIAAWIMQYLK